MEYGKAPWYVVGHNWQNTTVYDANKTPMCGLDLEDWKVTEENQEELEAQQAKVANLIAAAPDLFTALVGLLADITEYQTINKLGGENNHWQVRAREAIAKAQQQ